MDWAICIAEAGPSLHGYEYPETVLREALPLFDKHPVRAHPHRIVKGKMQFRHLPAREAHMAPLLIREMIGTIEQPWWHDGAILARLRMLPSCELSDSTLHGYGLSMQVEAQVTRDAQKQPVAVHTIGVVESVDLVDAPAAHGRILGPWTNRADAEKWHHLETSMCRFEESCQRYDEVERGHAILRRYEARLDAIVRRYEQRMHALGERM